MIDSKHYGALVALGAGVLILLKPKLLNYVIASYLIADGSLRLLGRQKN